MACSDDSKAVFVDTNLGTHFVITVSPNIIVKALKRELELIHLNLFPGVGNVRVNVVMVKWKSYYYHLSQSMPLKYAFWGSNRTWFLQIEVALESSLMKLPENGTPSESESESESVFVPRIITKYFSDYGEVALSSRLPFAAVRNKHKGQLNVRVDSKLLDMQADVVTSSKPFQVSKNVWPEKPKCGASRGNKKLEVGKHLLLASNNLALTRSNQKSGLSLLKFRNKKSLASSAMVRTLVFEITDEGK